MRWILMMVRILKHAPNHLIHIFDHSSTFCWIFFNNFNGAAIFICEYSISIIYHHVYMHYVFIYLKICIIKCCTSMINNFESAMQVLLIFIYVLPQYFLIFLDAFRFFLVLRAIKSLIKFNVALTFSWWLLKSIQKLLIF